MTCVSIFLWHLAARPGVEMKIVPCLDPRLLHLFRLHPDKAKSPGQSGKGSSQGGQPVRVSGKPRAKQQAKQQAKASLLPRASAGKLARPPLRPSSSVAAGHFWPGRVLGSYSAALSTFCYLLFTSNHLLFPDRYYHRKVLPSLGRLCRYLDI